MVLSEQSKMVDEILDSVDGRETAMKLMDVDSSEHRLTASEVIGHRFCIFPHVIRKWYEERQNVIIREE